MLDTGIDIREVVNLVFAKPVFSKIKFWQMIGRGTRTLEKNIFVRKPWCSEKEKFLIIDHWDNFERFGEKPEGEVPPVQDAVPVKIFKTRLEKLKIFQANKDAENFEKIKNEIIDDVKTLPENSIAIKENKRHIDKAISEQIWGDLDDKSYEFLEKNISPLMRYKSDLNLYQTQFLLKIEKLGLSILRSNHDEILQIKESIKKDVKRLPRNLSSVKEKEEYINMVLSDKFWEDLSYKNCELIKDNLTDIMKNKQLEEIEILKLDLDDLVAERKWIEFGPAGEGDFVMNYREKVERKVLDLAQIHPALNKIKNDIPISEQDIEDLENTLNGPDLYISENNLRKAFIKPCGTFMQFIKNIFGKYKFPNPEELINESFNTYVVERNNKNQLSADQLRFLRTIRSVFIKKKHIEYNDLFEPPFTSFGADATTRLFSEEELREIIYTFNKIAA